MYLLTQTTGSVQYLLTYLECHVATGLEHCTPNFVTPTFISPVNSSFTCHAAVVKKLVSYLKEFAHIFQGRFFEIILLYYHKNEIYDRAKISRVVCEGCSILIYMFLIRVLT